VGNTCAGIATLIDRLNHAAVKPRALVTRHGLTTETVRAVGKALVERRQPLILTGVVSVKQQFAPGHLGIRNP
jgi:hypothetical protein